MKQKRSLIFFAIVLMFASCERVEDTTIDDPSDGDFGRNSKNFNVNFQYLNTIKVGGEGASEISAYDPKSKKLFIVNVDQNEISVYNISNLNAPVEEAPIAISSGAPNSVAVHKGKLAVAVEDEIKQNPGRILIYDTTTSALINSFTVGALPDMVTFSPNGQFIVSANEGEPNDDYDVDPEGSISIIETVSGQVTTLGFDAFVSQQAELTALGFRIFGPNASLPQDIEPEYVAISDNSNYAWVTLQENNGIAKVNLQSKVIEAIYPLGFKDFDLPQNSLDASDRDDIKMLQNWPVKGIYHPDAIDYVKIGGRDYLITANEGDARDYDGFSEEERIDDLVLDATAFPDADFLQESENLGRLKITTTLGDVDGDGDYDELYAYGARSFSVWSGNGQLLFDSGNDIAQQTLNLTPDRFNDDDGRSDDKGAEPESIEILNIQGNKFVMFVGLERNDQILVYDISNPASPIFLSLLSHEGDEAPEGLLAIPAKDSPNGRDLLVVANEDSGTVTIYENRQ